MSENREENQQTAIRKTENEMQEKKVVGIPEGIREAIEQSSDKAGADIRTYSPLTLAFIGDSVYELMVRTLLVRRGERSIKVFNDEKRGYVSAEAQAGIYHKIEACLTEEEKEIFRRGRNAKPKNPAKHATLNEYLTATGLEALFGYLYLTGQSARMTELLQAGIDV